MYFPLKKCSVFISLECINSNNLKELLEWEIVAHLAVAGGVFDGVFLCCPFSHEVSWMRSGTELS